jgi:uncharacterized protein YqgC (DUF456 family)
MLLYIAVISFLLLLLLCALLNLASLPGNWIMAVLVGLWAAFGPENSAPMGIRFFLVFFALALAGEAVEFLSQVWGAKKYGSTNTSTFMGMIGAIAGAILFAPFLFGFGAVLGALAGAWGGCFLSERLLAGRSLKEAVTAANGALIGRFLGMTIKFGLGFSMLAWTAAAIWPS